MLLQEQIALVIDDQRDTFLKRGTDLPRAALENVPVIARFATIITGIRRCGKSTLLLQVFRERYTDALYINFEDIRLTGFEASDFSRLQQEIVKRGLRILFLDEVQLVEKWEIFVHQLLREEYVVFVTGSNASLLSKELGTHLTGRHLSMELFPFSYREYLAFKGLTADAGSLEKYLESGGFPEYVKNEAPEILQNLLEDILVRDIAVRHAIRDVESLKQLAIYLISNVGTLTSGNKLVGIFGIRSTATLLEYFAHFKNSYLLEFVPQYSHSLKAQSRNPKKVYTLDTGLISAVSTALTDNTGHRLENLVYSHLRHQHRELYYFKEKGECDFIIFNKRKAVQAIQVCLRMDDATFDREYNGLLEAMIFFKLKEGTIVTLDQKDVLEKDGYTVRLVPAYEFL